MNMYLGQRLYKNIGKKGQAKLCASKIVIVGVGALGSISAELLTRAGIGEILLIDRDFVEESNLQRQVLFESRDIGKPKAKTAEERLRKINPSTNIQSQIEDINYENIDLLGTPDAILAATDNMESRFLLNDYCSKNKIFMVYGGAVEDRGIVFSTIPGGTCLRCIFSGMAEETCDTSGILNSCSAIVGSMMANEAIKYIASGINEKDLIHFNIWKNEFSRIKVKRNPKCPACRGHYQYLDGDIRTRHISMCGKGAYHIKGAKKSLAQISQKLSRIGEVKRFGGILHFREITLFDDGRAIIKAATENEAKKAYSKYIGN